MVRMGEDGSAVAARPGYRPQLDGLRALAVGGVLWTHLCSPQSDFGTLGVRLFFVLSGFLITGMLLEGAGAGRRPLANFYIRRALRLLPAFYLLLGLMLLFNVQAIREVAPWHLFYASNFLFALRGDYIPWSTAAWWSLAVEEQFYLIWPAVVLFLPPRWLRWVCLGCIPAAIGYRLIVTGMDWPVQARLLLPGSIDALGAGALLAVMQRAGDVPGRLLAWLAAAGLLAMTVLTITGFHSSSWGRSIDLAVMVPLVWGGAVGFGGLAGRVLASPPAVYIGRISYGIYLWHLPVWCVLGTMPGGWRLLAPGPLLLLTGTAATVAMASLSWFALEAPANRLKRRFPFGEPVAREGAA